VHLHIERSFVDSVADQMELNGSRELSLGDAMHFQDPLVCAMLGALHRAAADPADSRPYVDTMLHTLAAHLLKHYARGHLPNRDGMAAGAVACLMRRSSPVCATQRMSADATAAGDARLVAGAANITGWQSWVNSWISF
jgi:hypothetical protein